MLRPVSSSDALRSSAPPARRPLPAVLFRRRTAPRPEPRNNQSRFEALGGGAPSSVSQRCRRPLRAVVARPPPARPPAARRPPPLATNHHGRHCFRDHHHAHPAPDRARHVPQLTRPTRRLPRPGAARRPLPAFRCHSRPRVTHACAPAPDARPAARATRGRRPPARRNANATFCFRRPPLFPRSVSRGVIALVPGPRVHGRRAAGKPRRGRRGGAGGGRPSVRVQWATCRRPCNGRVGSASSLYEVIWDGLFPHLLGSVTTATPDQSSHTLLRTTFRICLDM